MNSSINVSTHTAVDESPRHPESRKMPKSPKSKSKNSETPQGGDTSSKAHNDRTVGNSFTATKGPNTA